MSEFIRREISYNDKELFHKAIKLYYFVNHVRHNDLPEDLRNRFPHCSNVLYSLVRNYLEHGQLQIEYLDYLNQEVEGWNAADQQLFSLFHIQPGEIDEIELGEKVPIQFHDGETGERLRIVYYPELQYCDYSILFTN